MDALTTAAASGMRARMESLDMLANNIANASSPGFKVDREFYSLYLSAESADSPEGTSPVTLPVVERQWTDFAQGSITPTANPSDLALSGKGFFVATSSSGPVYTRDGSFHLSAQGEMETLDGYNVQAQDGSAIQLDTTKPFEVAPDGMVRQDGQDVAQLAIVELPDTNALVKQGRSYFRLDSSTITPSPAAGAQVQQGKLEAGNTQSAETAVRLVSVMRQFEMLQRAMAIGNDMNKRAVEDVAKVTG
jgi:flagellar basal-body rod protein FlgF